jgi:hypothetical protein
MGSRQAAEGGTLEIGKPLRKIVVEPIRDPVPAPAPGPARKPQPPEAPRVPERGRIRI